MKKGLKKLSTKTTDTIFSQPSFDPTQLEPNNLRDRIYNALVSLPRDERASMSDQIISKLKDFRVNVRTGLLMLGIPARTADDLTPSDLAKLMRYLRINAPKALEAISSPLSDLLTIGESFEKGVGSMRRAA